MAEMIEAVELAEQTLELEVQDPLITEYTQLGQEAAQAEYHDMAEYYAQKKQQILAEKDAINERMNQFQTDIDMRKIASNWEAMASTELRTNGLTDWYKHCSNEADATWSKLKNKADK